MLWHIKYSDRPPIPWAEKVVIRFQICSSGILNTADGLIDYEILSKQKAIVYIQNKQFIFI